MAMADVDDISLAVDSQPKATSWLDVRVGGHLVLSLIYQMNWVNSRSGSDETTAPEE